MEENRLLVLSGPTASGKTTLALALARLLPLEIVNADSMQVYRGMDIGTAKPSLDERREVPHHLVDVADPDEDYDAGRFAAEADAAIRGILRRGKFPLAAGGTGLYLRALLRGLDPLPKDDAVRRRLARRWEEEGGESLHSELRAIDPATAAAVHPSDRVRVLRALEVAEIAGAPPSAMRRLWAGRAARYRVLFLAISLDRDRLYRRIDARVDGMFRKGLVEEVQRLLDQGYPPELKPMKALGYRHVVSHLRGAVPLAGAIEEMKRDTRRYAKRQITWLRKEPEAVWIDADGGPEAAVEMAKKHLF